MPVILTTQVIDDTDNLRFEEKNRRFINVTPSTSKEKIQTAMEQICKRYGLTDEEYDYDVVNKKDKERAKTIVNVMIAKLIQHSKYFSPRKTGVKIPFEKAIAHSFPDRNNKVWLMTAVDRVIKYLAIITKINMDQRPKLINKTSGKFYPLSTFQDVADVLPS